MHFMLKIIDFYSNLICFVTHSRAFLRGYKVNFSFCRPGEAGERIYSINNAFYTKNDGFDRNDGHKQVRSINRRHVHVYTAD